MSVWEYVLVSAGALGGQKRASDSCQARVLGNCELSGIGAENQTLVLYEDSMCS